MAIDTPPTFLLSGTAAGPEEQANLILKFYERDFH